MSYYQQSVKSSFSISVFSDVSNKPSQKPECSNPACYDVSKPYLPRLNSTCPSKNYSAQIQNPLSPSQNTSFPVSDLYPFQYPNGTEFNPLTSFTCVKDPSESLYCYARFVRDVTHVSVHGSKMTEGEKKGYLCNSCVWRVLSGAKGVEAGRNRTLEGGGVEFSFEGLEEVEPRDFYPKYSGMVRSVCGSGECRSAPGSFVEQVVFKLTFFFFATEWLDNAANGQVPYQSLSSSSSRIRTVMSCAWVVVGAVSVGAVYSVSM